ncbi:hypothetical protein [Deinococcus aquaedulcis]|uniref:hypothetical protein n=1 Tax=Deinococcus aquaedulcis TaxID=2840455 RepID=UPI001C833E4D|nr:hypothetical protein [Deinococcus aquaedulcis]
MKKIPLLVLPLTLALYACGQNQAPTVNLQTAQQSVPLLQSQALVLSAGMQSQTITPQNADRVQFDSVLVEDFDGNPFYYLTVSSTTAKGATFWDALSTAQDDYKLYGTGASIDRNLYAFEFRKAYGDQLLALSKRVGARRLVSPHSQLIYLQDQAGQFWDVSTGQKVPDKTIAAQREEYAQLKADYFAHPEDVAGMHATWARVAKSAEQLGGQSVKSLALQDGNLNVAAALRVAPEASVQAQGSESDIASRGWFGWINSRAGVAGSGLDGPAAMSIGDQLEGPAAASPAWTARYNADFGNQQQATDNPFDHPRTFPDGAQWGMRLFNPFHGGIATGQDEWQRLYGARIGCVPLSLIRAVNINALTDASNSRLRAALESKYQGGSVYTNLKAMNSLVTRPVDADSIPAGYKEPWIDKVLGAGEFQGGTLVTPNGIGAGGQTVINEMLGPGFTLAGGIRFSISGLFGVQTSNTFFNFNSWTYNIRDAVRTTMNDDGHAVSFLYATGGSGGFEGHMATAYAYRVYEHVGYSDVFVYKDQAQDYRGYNAKEGFPGTVGWINITNRWSNFQGAIGIRAQ